MEKGLGGVRLQVEQPVRKEAASITRGNQSLDAEGGLAVSMAQEGQIPETEVPAHSEWGDQERMPKFGCFGSPGCPHAQEHRRGHDA